MTDFLAIYKSTTKDDIRHNRHSVAERLGFLDRLVHGHDLLAWTRELKARLAEPVNYAETRD